MLSWLGTFLEKFWEQLMPCYIVEQYNEAVQLRNGKFIRHVKKGLWGKIPFTDKIYEHAVIPTTMDLTSQSLVTRDDKNIVVKAIIKYRVYDVKIFLLEVMGAREALEDMTKAIIKKIITALSWEDCKTTDVDNQITIKARNEAKKWGIEIIQVSLTDIGLIWSVRLFNDTHPS